MQAPTLSLEREGINAGPSYLLNRQMDLTKEKLEKVTDPP